MNKPPHPAPRITGRKRKPVKPNKALLALWKPMSVKHRQRFAMLAGTSVGSLRQYVEGRREISAALAAQIQKATKLMGVAVIDRTQLNATCKRCDYAKQCLALAVKPKV